MANEERLGASFTIDITSLKAGLAQANRLIRESESEFKAAAAGLDDWTKSEEGLTAKIKSLNSITETQRTKVNALKAEYKRLIDNGLDPTSAEAVKLRTQINNEEAALKKNEAELRRQEEALEDVADASDETTDAFEDTEKATGKANEGFTVMKGALANLVAEGFKKAISAAKEFASQMVQTAAEVKAEKSQYEQAFGDLVDAADDAVDRVSASTGILRDRLTGTAAGIYSFARSSGASTKEAMELMETALMATADSAAYYDKSLEDSAETLQSFLKGNFANDAALGLSATEFTRNAKATELFGKKYTELSEIEKQKTLLKMVTDSQKLSGAMGQASRESDGFENVMGNVNETWRQFKAQVGTPVLESLIPVIQDVTKEFTKWKNSINWNQYGKTVTTKIKDIIQTVKTLAKNALPTLKTALSAAGKVVEFVAKNFQTLVTVGLTAITVFKTFQAVLGIKNTITAVSTAVSALTVGTSAATKAQVGLNAAMAANPIGAVATAVAALTTGLVLLIKAQKDAQTSVEVLSKSQREAVTAAQSAADSYRETKAAAEKMAGAELANINYTQQLWQELQTLADKNGKVKEGYEGRAQFILNELNNALGTEYKLNGDVIQSYKDIASSIDEVIEKKKAQILLDAYQESYEEAVKNVTAAEQARAVQAQELALLQDQITAATAKSEQAQAKYEDRVRHGGEASQQAAYNEAAVVAKELENLQKTLSEKTAAYNASDTALQDYYNSINGYETASTLVLQGETSKAIDYLNSFGNGFQTAASLAKKSAEEQKQILEQQVVDTEVNLQLMEAEYASRSAGMTDEEKRQAQERIKNAKKQANDAKEEFKKVGGNITKGIGEGAEGEKWTLSTKMQSLISSAVQAAKKAAGIKSPSRLFKREVGRFIGLGVAAGIDDSTGAVVKSVKSQIKRIESAYDFGDVSTGVDVGLNYRKNKNSSDTNGATAGGVVVYQTNNYSQAHSRLEIYKSKQQTAAAVRLAMGGV